MSNGRRWWFNLTAQLEVSKDKPRNLRTLRDVAVQRAAMARTIGWPALEQSFLRDVKRANELLGEPA